MFRGVLLSVLVLAACGGAAAERRYPASVRAGFLSDCASSGAPDAICGCELGALEERYSLTEFLAYDESYRVNGVLSPDVLATMAQGAAEC